MYEHFRNELMLDLSTRYSGVELDIILATLDKVASNYDITEKVTSLVVYDDTFNRYANMYLQSRKIKGCSDNTIKFYGLRLKQFHEWVGKNPEDVTKNDVRRFLVDYKFRYPDKEVDNITMDKFRQIISGFFTWLVNEEYLEKNPCRNIDVIKFEQKPRKSLNRRELEVLRRACRDKENKRDLAMVDVLFSTGCRVSELINMKKSEINYAEKSIHIIGKGRKHHTCYFNDNAQLSLEDYLNSRDDDSDYLFVSMRKPHNKLTRNAVELVFRNYAKECNLKLTPHVMRHTTATIAYKNGMKIEKIQKLINHSNINTTMIYAETSQEDVMNDHHKYVI